MLLSSISRSFRWQERTTMTAPLDPYVVSTVLQREIAHMHDTLAALIEHLRGAEAVIAEARAVVRYWDAGPAVLDIAALAAALDAWDALPARASSEVPSATSVAAWDDVEYLQAQREADSATR